MVACLRHGQAVSETDIARSNSMLSPILLSCGYGDGRPFPMRGAGAGEQQLAAPHRTEKSSVRRVPWIIVVKASRGSVSLSYSPA